MFDPTYTLTNRLVTSLTVIAEAKAVIERARILPIQELRLRRQALARMTHSSTAIEGNALNLQQVEALVAHRKVDAADRDIYEVQNYLNALRYIEKVVATKQPVTEKVILHIHKFVTDKTLPPEQSGHYRKGSVYVVRRQLGRPPEILYTAPGATVVPSLVTHLIAWIQESEKKEIHPVIVAGIVHQEIAAIHPFADGNGRTARALATLVLYQRGYDFRRLFALEDYYNEDRPGYYAAINIGKNYPERRTDFTPWLEYFVKGFEKEIMVVKDKVISLAVKGIGQEADEQLFLDKDQLKIIDFIEYVGRATTKDVVDIVNCPPRTAQLYLKRLKEIGIIIPIGKGKATYYVLK